MIGDRRRSLLWWTFGVSLLVDHGSHLPVHPRDRRCAGEYVASLPRGAAAGVRAGGCQHRQPGGLPHQPAVLQPFPDRDPCARAGPDGLGGRRVGERRLTGAGPGQPGQPHPRWPLARFVGAAVMVAFVTVVSTRLRWYCWPQPSASTKACPGGALERRAADVRLRHGLCVPDVRGRRRDRLQGPGDCGGVRRGRGGLPAQRPWRDHRHHGTRCAGPRPGTGC